MRSKTIPFLLAASLSLLAWAPGCQHRKPDATSSGEVADAGEGVPTETGYRRVTFADTRAKELADGARVEVEVVMLPGTLAHTTLEQADSGTAPSKYFMLAIPSDATYLKTLAEIRDDLTKLRDSVAKAGAGAAADLDPLFKEHDAIVKRIEATKVAPAEAIAVELGVFDESRVRVAWDKTIRECTGIYCMPDIPAVPHFDITPLDPCAFAISAEKVKECLATAEKRLDELGAQDPPILDQDLPKLPSPNLSDPAAVARFNKLVPRYNKEVTRRNAAKVASLPEKVERLLRVLDARRGTPWTVHGTLATPPGMVARIYRETLGDAPPRVLREAADEPKFASGVYAKTRYCFTSQPPGADIIVRGAKSGRTPACVDGLSTGEEVDIHLELPRRTPAKVETVRVTASPSNLTEFDCMLAGKSSANPSTCRIVF